MRPVLAISPHLDDAVFSAGGTLARHAMNGDEVVVLTCFTGNVPRPEGFALACQLDKGLPPDVDYMALRRTEDRAACEAIDARALHLPFLEAPHRGYANAADLFGGRRAEDEPLVGELAAAVAQHIERIAPSIVYGPLGVGDHVDHHVVRDAVSAAVGSAAIRWWEDFPYAMKDIEPAEAIIRHPLDPASAAAKLRAVLCYTTQLGFQFGSAERAAAILAQWTQEGFACESTMDSMSHDRTPRKPQDTRS